MSNEEQILATLQKILEAQEGLLAVQKQAVENQRQALASQQLAVKNQLATGRIYRVALGVLAVFLALFVYFFVHVWR